MSERLTEIIAGDTGIDIAIVQQQRAVNTREAVEKYFSPEVKERLIEEGRYFPDGPKTRDEKMRMVGLSLLIGNYKEEFYKTPEGKLWFDCNVPSGEAYAVMCDEIYRDAQKYAKSIAEGQRRTLMTLGRKRNSFVG